MSEEMKNSAIEATATENTEKKGFKKVKTEKVRKHPGLIKKILMFIIGLLVGLVLMIVKVVTGKKPSEAVHEAAEAVEHIQETAQEVSPEM